MFQPLPTEKVKLIVHHPISPERAQNYYSSGWTSFSDFYSKQDWKTVFCCEQNPESVLVDGKIRKVRPDFAQAKNKLLLHAVHALGAERVIYLEFGVRAGISMRFVSDNLSHPNCRLHGFDTFTGLPEGWLPSWGGHQVGRFREPGEMAVEQMPEIPDPRVVLHKGLFQETLPALLESGDLRLERLFINIDCDTYTGALYVLTQLHSSLKRGDVVYFDEFHDELNEFAAFNDYVRSYYVRDHFQLIGRAYDAYCFRYDGVKV